MAEVALQDGKDAGSTLREAMAGDQAAFTLLVAEHTPAMARVAFCVTNDVERSREAVQAAWTIAWRRVGGLRDPGRLRPWLVAIAANEARQLGRRDRRRAVVELAVGQPAANAGDPADRIGLVDLERALRALSGDDRALVALRYGAGLDSTQIGAITRRSPAGVRNRLARVIECLRKDLDHG